MLFDGDTVPQELTNLGGEAATMSMSRMPAYFQETSVRYEKARISHHENYEMERPPSNASRCSLGTQSQSAESDVLPMDMKYR